MNFMTRYTTREFCSFLGIEPPALLPTFFSSVAIDSRKVTSGGLFIALEGDRVDGHDYVKEALKRGAAAALVKNSFQEAVDLPLLRVADTFDALQLAAQQYVASRRKDSTVIAITGSVGKTTTKHFIETLLRPYFSIFSPKGNQNSQRGLPLAILNEYEGNEEVLLVEVSMSEKGQIQRHTEIIPPDIALLTNISLVHAENFSSLETLAEAKGEVFSHPHTQYCICPYKEHQQFFREKEYLTYSVDEKEADWSMSREPFFFIEKGESFLMDEPQVPSERLFSNVLATMAVGRLMGLSIEQIEKGLRGLTLPPMRLEKIEKKGLIFIKDCYNAAEDSICLALDYLSSIHPERRKLALLSGVRELGPFAEEVNQKVGSYALSKADILFCFEEEARPFVAEWERVGRRIVWRKELSDLIEEVRKELKEGDVLLVKGSRKYKLEDALETILGGT